MAADVPSAMVRRERIGDAARRRQKDRNAVCEGVLGREVYTHRTDTSTFSGEPERRIAAVQGSRGHTRTGGGGSLCVSLVPPVPAPVPVQGWL